MWKYNIILAFTGTCSIATAEPLPIEARAPAPFSNFVNNIAFHPGPEYTEIKTFYGRSAQLPDQSLLLTWENYRREPPIDNFLIYRSTDGGATWDPYSSIEDTANGWGMRWHPFLYVLPQMFAGYAAGTVLAAGTSIPKDISKTWIDLHIAYGSGPADARDEGHKAVWEPFLMVHKNQLVCFYSDQTDPAHSQKLVHVTTSDLKTWSKPVDDVTDPNQNGRPGMTVVAHIASTNKYIMTYEDCVTNNCALTYKVSSSPLTFNSVKGTAVVSNDSAQIAPGSTSFVTWTLHPNRKDGSGLIYANSQSSNLVFVNEDTARPDGWKTVDVGQNEAYSRELRVINDNGKRKLMLVSAGVSGGSNNMVGVGVVDLPV
ncbi:hypothetical protein ACHAPJ_008509 [Fusarium lateritium]